MGQFREDGSEEEEVSAMRWWGKRRLIAAAAAGLVVVMLLIGAAVLPSARETPAIGGPVAEVNGEPVSARELAHFAALNRAYVMEYFMNTYGADYGRSFWHQSYNGETPSGMLHKRALQDAVRMKVELGLAKEEGLLEGISFDDVLGEMAKENARRKQAADNGQPVYGPVKFEESTFVDFYRSKLLTELKERLSRSVLSATEEQLKAHYEAIKPELFRTEGKVTYNRISVAYRKDGSESARGKEQALNSAEQVRQLLEGGRSADEAVKELLDAGADAGLQLDRGEEFNDRTASRIFKSQPQLYTALMELTGSRPVSPVNEDRQSGQYWVVQLIAREGGGFKSFEEARDQVRKHYTEAAFEVYIQERVQAAVVTVTDELKRMEDRME